MARLVVTVNVPFATTLDGLEKVKPDRQDLSMSLAPHQSHK
jgi:hypothetical protein